MLFTLRSLQKGRDDLALGNVLGVVIMYASFIILLNLVADVLYRVLDPRVRYEL